MTLTIIPPAVMPTFYWANPDYASVWKARLARLAKLRHGDPERGISGAQYLEAARRHYRDEPGGMADFVEHWGVTVDPRNAGTVRPVVMPFVLFPKQREFIGFMLDRWRTPENGILVKSRDCGASWLAMAVAVTMCLFWNDISIGFGSRKEDLVDDSGNPDSLFYKGRKFVEYLPTEFKGQWTVKKNSSHMFLGFPDSNSSVTGEAGDNIGRGGRKAIYIVDEFAHVERPALVDAALVANTKCRIEMSSVNGLANTFAERARGGKIKRFDFHYLDDPRKVDQVTKKPLPEFAKFLAELDPVTRAAEYECDFLASVEGAVIESAWVQAAIGAAEALGIVPTGARTGSYDIADTGKDKNAYVGRHGIEVFFTDQWSGTGSNPMTSVRKVFELGDDTKVEYVRYDGDGMGASWRDYFKNVNEERVASKRKPLPFHMFRGSGPVLDPESKTPGTDRKNLDYLENQKAQSWMALRRRFFETFKAINGEAYDRDAIISLSPKLKHLSLVVSELSQPTRAWSKTGKLMIDKVPDGVMSPNLADAVMMAFCYARPPLKFSDDLLDVL